jgi:crotonobetainyl-CoA:carnitine CoA-transferase CaiB-like acyl-CoA transferase
MEYAPLKDVYVLDCSTLLPGPYCTMMLAEMGAKVVKVERAGTGDTMREVIPGCFDYLNGNKSFVTLNLKHQKGLEIFLKIAKKADVIVEGFRPGIAKRLGIDFDSVKKVNPSIIYCAISGHGQTGPYCLAPGHDINYQGMSGLMSLSGDPDKGPCFPDGFQVADLSGSMFALASILGALNGRKHSSDPIYLDISISESLAMWMMPRYFEYLDLNRPSKSVFMGRGPYGVFETKDNHYITIGVVEDHFWVNLCKVLGLEGLSSDSSLKGWHTRNQERKRIVPRIKAAIKEKDADYWIKTMTDADVPVAPVCDFENWKDNPQFQDRGFFPEDTDKKKFRRFPVNNLIDHTLKEAEPVALGMNNAEIIKELGLSEDDIKQLKSEGAI